MTTSFTELSQALSDIITQTSRSVVAIQGRRSAGSGIHWHQGLIVTSCEALHPNDALTLTLPEGDRVNASLLGSDPTTDIAVLSLPAGVDLPVVTLGEAEALALGQLVSTVGRSAQRGVFASLGMVSQIGGPWRSQSGGQIDRYIVVDLNLQRGSAGCPLIDASGKVVGFNTYGPRRKILSIPASTINPVIQQLQQRGKVSQGYLGVGMQRVPLPDAIRQQHGFTNQAGILTVSVDTGSAADQAGMLLGDVIIAVDDSPIESLQQMQALLGPQSVGQKLEISLLRGGQMQTVTATVGDR